MLLGRRLAPSASAARCAPRNAGPVSLPPATPVMRPPLSVTASQASTPSRMRSPEASENASRSVLVPVPLTKNAPPAT